MSFETLLYIWDGFSFIIFVIILLSSLLDIDYFKSNLKLIVVSFLLSIGMFLFYREQYALSEGNIYPLFTFFTYFFTAISHMLIVTLIVTLYTKKVIGIFGNSMITFYGVVVGIIMAINVSYGNFVSTHILIGIINMIPLIHLFIYIVKYDKKFYFNVFLIQTLALLLVYIFKTINLVINIDSLTLVIADRTDIGFLTIANIIIYSFIISYLLAKNIMVNNELNKHKLVIEGSLYQAIKLSEIDVLTGVFNRRKIHDVIQQYLDMSFQNDRIFSIVMIDINNFKYINDTYGHNTGDAVLRFVGNVLKQLLRDIDIVSRWGGDEFLLLLPNTNLKAAKIVIKKISDYLDTNECEATKGFISLSFGISDNSDSVGVEEMIDLADQRMYDDKKNKETK